MIEKKTRKRKTDFAPHIEEDKAPRCEMPGCDRAGVYKAPASPTRLDEYHWFCLDHIREHNQKWNFFSGMSEREIEQFMRDAVTGHRPTWTRESHMQHSYEKLQDALHEFMHGAAPKRHKAPPLSAKFNKALTLLDLEYPYTLRALKTQYRLLVKQHHPDVNKGDKMSEEKFKEITAAYTYLGEMHKKRNEHA